MVIFLSEQDIQDLLTMDIALDQVEAAMKALAQCRATDVPRARIQTPSGIQHVLQAAAPELGYIGFKYYYTVPGQRSAMYVHLINMKTGKLEAIVEARWQSMIRTGAASGVASRALANPGATTVAQLGAGYQGMGQLEAVVRALKLREARVYAPTRDKLEAWCKKMSIKLDIPVIPAASPQEAIRGAQVINVITKSATPVLDGDWLEPGQHINAAGSNALSRREIDARTVTRCALITVDARGTAARECGDLLPAVENGRLNWDTLTEIGEVLAGLRPGRGGKDDITLYESHGMGIQDVYTAVKMLELARSRKLGTELPM